MQDDDALERDLRKQLVTVRQSIRTLEAQKLVLLEKEKELVSRIPRSRERCQRCMGSGRLIEQDYTGQRLETVPRL